jgi:hypothetical protein
MLYYNQGNKERINTMRYPICPHCGWLLQINYYADDYEEDNDFICVVQGSCPNPHCQRKYTWEEVYKLADTRDLQEAGSD